MTLADGRRLAYEEYGRADGRPVVCMHGIPGSRLMWSLFDDPAQRRDVRVVAPDRPGFGASEFQPDRDLLDWAGDVAELAARLDLREFGVVGFSGGGPHAAACAHELTDRVRAAVLVSSVAPPGTHEYASAYVRGLRTASESVPGASRTAFGAVSWLASNWRRRFRTALENRASERDRRLLDRPEGDVILADAVEAFRQGGRGPAHEFTMLAEDWGFDPAGIEVPVAVWHGREDATVDAAMATAFADALPDPDLSLVDAGHYSTLVDNAAAILDDAIPE